MGFITGGAGGAGLPADTVMPLLQNPDQSYFQPGWARLQASNVDIAEGTLYYIPIYIASVAAWTHLSIGNAGFAVGKVTRVGIYSAKKEAGCIRPDALLFDGGTVSVGTQNTISDIVLTISLAKGWYFLAIIDDDDTAAVTYNSMAAGLSCAPVSSLGDEPYMDTNESFSILTVTGQSANSALPDPAPDATGEVNGSVACVYLKLAMTA